MRTKVSFDEKCYELAEYFMEEPIGKWTPADKTELAELLWEIGRLQSERNNAWEELGEVLEELNQAQKALGELSRATDQLLREIETPTEDSGIKSGSKFDEMPNDIAEIIGTEVS